MIPTTTIFKKAKELSLTLLLCIGLLPELHSQIAPGEWRDHLPYRLAKRLSYGDNKIYCSTSHSLFFYDLADNSINKISKVQGLTDNSISLISYVQKQKSLLIVYENASIDLLKDNKKIETIPYLKNKLDINNKKINEIDIINDLVYLSCGFGLTVLDPEKKVFRDTYYPGAANKINEVYDVCTDGANIYASTELGIFSADINDPFLIDFNRWTLLKSFGNTVKSKKIEFYDNKLFVHLTVPGGYKQDSIIYLENSVWKKLDLWTQNFQSMVKSMNRLVITGTYQIYVVGPNLNISFVDGKLLDDNTNYALFDEKGNLWAANEGEGLALIAENSKSFYPDGPLVTDIQNISLNEDDIWIANGSTSGTYNWTSNNSGFSVFRNNKWEVYAPYRTTGFPDTLRDLISVAINPRQPDQAFFASYYSGLFEFNNGSYTIYTSKNSGLQEDYKQPGSNLSMVYGIDYDKDGNLWMTNSRVKKPLVVRKNDGKWKSFALEGFNDEFRAGPVLVASSNYKWVLSPLTANIIAFDDNGTIDVTSDDQSKTISVSKIESLTQSNYVYSIAEDKEGNIWVGTDAGPVVVRNAQYVFDDNYSVSKVKITLSEEDNTAAFLLEQEKINAIAIDGNNRKWFATENSGVYLISEDATVELAHFTAENSPLLSNTVVDIDIHPKTGEVFFATNKGLISYRGYATEGSDEFGDVYVFPNPVRENYEGDIIVTNLLTDADVRITDISGNLVFKTKALGGQAVWNGKNLLGKRVNTGVYLVFCSNEDGTKTFVTKLLFIH